MTWKEYSQNKKLKEASENTNIELNLNDIQQEDGK